MENQAPNLEIIHLCSYICGQRVGAPEYLSFLSVSRKKKIEAGDIDARGEMERFRCMLLTRKLVSKYFYLCYMEHLLKDACVLLRNAWHRHSK